MKHFLIITLLIITGNTVSAQYGQEGAILAAAETVIRQLETTQMKKAAKAQDNIVIAQLTIAATTIEIVRIEQEILNSQSKLETWVEGMSVTLELVERIAYLSEITTKTVEYAYEVPEVLPGVSKSTLSFVADGAAIMKDYKAAIKESNTNLLTNQERIEVILGVQEGIDYLIQESLKLYTIVEMYASLTALENAEPPSQIYFDNTIPLTETQSIIDDLFIKK